MTVTLAQLLKVEHFHLRLLSDKDAPELGLPIAWVHSSDLADPTPWLEPGQFLLTDGDQLRAGRPDADAALYVARLRARGVLGLGFATDIIHDQIPAQLIAECVRQNLTLIEVARKVPFMAIIRHVADEIARDQRTRLEWSMSAQRSIASAATRPDGLAEILRELESRLDCWVVLFDAVGDRVSASPVRQIPDEVAAELEEAVATMLSRGTRAATRLIVAGGQTTLQSLGQGGRLRGVLAVGSSSPLDPAGSDLVASVIALASIALEQNQTIVAARRALRTSLIELILAGEVDTARGVAKPIWGRLPGEPVRLAVIGADQASDALLTSLELAADRSGAHMLVAAREDELLIIAADSKGDSGAESLLARHKVHAGISAPAALADLPRAMDEARRALKRTSPDRASVRFDAIAGDGVMGLLDQAGARTVARRVLLPLRESGRADTEILLVSAATWLAHNGAWDPAAKLLGVHRHTLRSRISIVEDLLGLNLDRFAHRAELWAALEFDGVEPALVRAD